MSYESESDIAYREARSAQLERKWPAGAKVRYTGFNSEDFIGGKVYTVKSAGCCNGPQDFVYFEESPSPFVYLDELELVNPAKDLTKRLNKVFEVMEKEGICFHVNGELYLVLKDSEEMYLVIDKECRSDVNPQFVTELPPIMEFKLRKDKP